MRQRKKLKKEMMESLLFALSPNIIKKGDMILIILLLANNSTII